MPKHPGKTINDPDYRYDLYYQDNGCIVAPKCLTCPLVQCVLDDLSPWEAINRWRYRERNERIRARVAVGDSKDLIARDEGIRVRTVNRVLEGKDDEG